jgi:hypothetical protein
MLTFSSDINYSFINKKMKNIAVLLLITLSLSCNPLINISTQGLTYDGTDVYYNGELCAKFSAVELAYDNRKIVREVTFLIVSPKFNDQALSILKLVTSKNPKIEVEVQLNSEEKSY